MKNELYILEEFIKEWNSFHFEGLYFTKKEAEDRIERERLDGIKYRLTKFNKETEWNYLSAKEKKSL
jgi:hypothetical protein